MGSNNLITNFDQDLDDEIHMHYNSVKVPDTSNNKLGIVRNRKTKFGSFQSVLKFKRVIEIDTNLESETDCAQELKQDL
jgi:hypothetical protein